MARQVGPNYIVGTIGDLVYYKRNGKYFVRRKGGPKKGQIKNSPSYAGTRMHNKDMAAFGKGVKAIRQAFSTQFAGASDEDMVSRLGKKVWEVVKSDKKHDKGSRRISNGDIALLNNFKFNKDVDLGNILKAKFTSTMDRKSGRMTVHVPSFNPATALECPAGATHFRLVTCVAEIQFGREKVVKVASEGEYIALDSPSVPAITFTSFLHNTEDPMLMSLGIQFFQETNGNMYRLNDAAYNPVNIVDVVGRVAKGHSRPVYAPVRDNKHNEQLAAQFAQVASDYFSSQDRQQSP